MITIKKKNYVPDKCYSSTVVFKKFPYNIRIPSYLRTVIFHNFSLLAPCGIAIKIIIFSSFRLTISLLLHSVGRLTSTITIQY